MRHDIVEKLLLYLFVISVFFLFSSGGGMSIGTRAPDAMAKKAGPPPHAKAHGYRAKRLYRYYPSAGVYFDTGTKAYFYLEGGTWRMSVSLPRDIRFRLGDYVSIEIDSDKPYAHYDEHKRNYPPGQLKEKKKKWHQ
jgi:hypothetical protein